MHRPSCWTTAVELNTTAAIAIGSSVLDIGWSSTEQPATMIDTTAQRTVERACLGVIEASAQQRSSIRSISRSSDDRREPRP
jgi:hypothetical protein